MSRIVTIGQEVTVTAERYGATVQTTPVAVTAFSPEVLEERQVTNVLQAASEIPGIVVVSVGPRLQIVNDHDIVGSPEEITDVDRPLGDGFSLKMNSIVRRQHLVRRPRHPRVSSRMICRSSGLKGAARRMRFSSRDLPRGIQDVQKRKV